MNNKITLCIAIIALSTFEKTLHTNDYFNKSLPQTPRADHPRRDPDLQVPTTEPCQLTVQIAEWDAATERSTQALRSSNLSVPSRLSLARRLSQQMGVLDALHAARNAQQQLRHPDNDQEIISIFSNN